MTYQQLTGSTTGLDVLRVDPYIGRQNETMINVDLSDLKYALKDVTIWLESALRCKNWQWDQDQREAAEECVATAKSLISTPADSGTGSAKAG